MKPNRIFLIDCQAVCYRALYSCGNLKTSQGVPSGIYYGFFNTLYKLALRGECAHFVFCWDSRQSLRKQIYPEYKGNREHTPDTVPIFEQFKYLRTHLLPRLGFTNNLFKIGYEADDLIASICKYTPPKRGREYGIVSSDKDLYQLLTPRISMWEPSGKIKKYTYEDFCDEWKTTPDVWGKVKAISGCKTDGVPGIPGIGEKNAIRHLTVKPNPRLMSPGNQEIIERNKKLVVLPFWTTPKFKLNWEETPKFDAFVDMCHEYEFSTFLKRVGNWRSIFNGVPPSRMLRNQ